MAVKSDKVKSSFYPTKEQLDEIKIHVIRHGYKSMNEFILKAVENQRLMDNGQLKGQLKL